MSRASIRPALWIVVALCLFAAASPWAAEEPVIARLDASGAVTLGRAGVDLGVIELNAHGPQWKHAPQSTATAVASDLPNQGGRHFIGTLPIPNTEGGVLRFTETVQVTATGLHLEYDVAVVKALKLNALQLSLELPTTVYAGKELTLSRLEGEPDIVGFPAEQNFSGWGGEAARVEVAKGTPEAIALELRAATDVMIQDLRAWQQQTYEIRFPAVTNDQGQDLTPEDRFHLDLNVTVAGPLKLVGP